MRQILLAFVLILVPVAAFTAVELLVNRESQAVGTAVISRLGDLSAFKTIAVDVQAIAATGDFSAAEQRITDLETAWDDAEATLRPQSPDEWETVDRAIDDALRALRRSPTAENVTAKLAALVVALDNPAPLEAPIAGGPTLVAGIAVTDVNGHPIPCEDLVRQLREALAANRIADANVAAATDFQAKATERCNADDDVRADEFAARGLALAGP